jgi:pimeloyl-ACP methyl ester carboxylesterase
MPVPARVVWRVFVVLFVVLLLGVPVCPGQVAAERSIVETNKPITVDGKLDEWGAFEELVIDKTPEGKTLLPSADLTVTARLAFDAEYLYVGVKVIDDQLVFPERLRREGDSLFLILVDLDPAADGRRYLTYMFSKGGAEDIKLLASRNGKPYPPSFVKDILLKVQPEADHKSIVYEAAIPWRYLPDFRPFLQPVWGVNLSCVDYDEKTHKTVQLVPDAGLEDSLSNARKGLAFRFLPHAAAAPEFQSLLSANHYFPQDQKRLDLAINSPSEKKGWQLRLQLSSASGNVQTKMPLAFGPGLSVLHFPIEVAKPVSGIYDFSLGVLDEKGSLRFSEDKQFFVLDPPEFGTYAAKIAEVKKGEAYAKDPVLRESLPTLEVRVQRAEEFMKRAAPFDDIDALERWNEEIKELLRYVEAGKPALFPTGRTASLGYRSPVDGTLRSYAVFIPEWYDKKYKFPLYVSLGGGADSEREVAVLEAVNYGPRVQRKAGDLIIFGAPPELAADWYADVSGKEILAAIESLKKLYSINDKDIILDGFDRGAYGALRLALLNPDTFKGVVLRSGKYIPSESAKSENVFELLDRAKKLSVLVVHGDLDELAPVADARALVERLIKSGAAAKFIEVKEGGHADFDRWSEIFGWLDDLLGNAVVKTRPPRKVREKPEQDPDMLPVRRGPGGGRMP